MSEKRVLTVADIAAVSDQIVEEVPIPEWGGSVYVRLLPARDGMALQEATVALPPERQSSARWLLLAAVMCDEAGALLFPATPAPAVETGIPGATCRLAPWPPWDAAKAEEVLGKRQPEPLERLSAAAVALRKRVEGEKKGDSKTTEASASSTASP